MALKSKQFWLVFAMSSLSILFGYYTVDIYKVFGQTNELLNHDAYLTWVGSLGSVCTSLRFLWSAALDHLPYRLIYGVLLSMQIALACTMSFAVRSQTTYLVWICLALFCEGGHFTIVPNTLKKTFGEQATSLYGFMLTYTGFSSLALIVLLETKLGKSYIEFYLVAAGCSLMALILLILAFDESKFVYDPDQLKAAVKKRLKKTSDSQLFGSAKSSAIK
mmetsp:Transcript_19004/g.23547  ORF Transcript_19004/g.23547 Transcript_19004/m.23547 type:complete len:220 (+) Transcript_19004:1162-1821(+)